MEIKVGDKFNCYDDGKVRVSRQEVITITNIIPYKECDDMLIEEILREVEDYDFLYKNAEQSVVLIGTDSAGEEYKFIKTKDGDFFSIGEWGPGLLDTSGDFTEYLINSLINGDYDYSKEEVEYYIEKLKKREICEDMNTTKSLKNMLKRY